MGITAASLTALVWLLAGDLFSNGLAPIDTGASPAELRARSCQSCHSGAHAEWARSRHGQAFSNAIFQREYRQQPLEWCVHCHAPLREQLREVRAAGGRPEPAALAAASSLAGEGVGCASCHIRAGRMLATHRRPGSPHDTVARPDFGAPAFCAGCHQFNFPIIAKTSPAEGASEQVRSYSVHPMQDTVAQHARGRFAATPCLTCHGDTPGGHLFPGGHDPGMLARAVSLQTCRQRGQLRVIVTNVGAGHNVPTGDLHRHLFLRAWRPSAPERLHETFFGRRFAALPDGGKRTVHDSTLAPGAARTIDMPIAQFGRAASTDEPIHIELRLVYTIDEFPFRGKELPLTAPTYATMVSREITLAQLAACGAGPKSLAVRSAARVR